jgi:hypothetical protein
MDAQVVPSSASSDLPELLRQAEEESLNLRLEMRAVAKAAAYEQLEEGLVRSVVAEWSAHVQEQRQSSIEPPPLAMTSSAIASAENGNTCALCVWRLRRTRCCFLASTWPCVRSAQRRFLH